jgi:hypothetical protein
MRFGRGIRIRLVRIRLLSLLRRGGWISDEMMNMASRASRLQLAGVVKGMRGLFDGPSLFLDGGKAWSIRW